MRGCRGGLTLSLSLVLLVWLIPLLPSTVVALDNPAGAIALVTVAVLAFRPMGRDRAGRRPAPETSRSGFCLAPEQPRARAARRQAQDYRLALAGSHDRIGPLASLDRRLGGSVHGLRQPGPTNPVRVAVYPGTPIDAGVRRARDPLPARLRFGILQRDSFRCRYCGRSGTASGVVLHVDHVVPFAAGGATSEDNLVTACEECNLGKGTRAVVAVGRAANLGSSNLAVASSPQVGALSPGRVRQAGGRPKRSSEPG